MEAKTVTIAIRMSPGEKEAIRLAAKRMDLSISEYLRLLTQDVSLALASGADQREVMGMFSITADGIVGRLEKLPKYRTIMSMFEELKGEDPVLLDTKAQENAGELEP